MSPVPSYRMPFLYLPRQGMRPYFGPPGRNPAADFRWAIIGGGIHGTYLANVLKNAAGVPESRIAVFDPGESPLSFWKRVTASTGMTHLRSSSVHHIDYFPVSLRRYYQQHSSMFPRPFIPKYNRPSLPLFNSHCDWIIDRESLADHFINARITHIEKTDAGWMLTSEDRDWTTANIILAIGAGEQPVIPEWAAGLYSNGKAVHLFDREFPLERDAFKGRHVCIIGGGISAMQKGVALSETGGVKSCTLLADHPVTEHDFDSDPSYIGPRKLKLFHKEKDPDARRELISSVRLPGSGDPGLVRKVFKVLEAGDLNYFQGRVIRAGDSKSGVFLEYRPSEKGSGNKRLTADTVILATGFSSKPPGGALIDSLVENYSLPVSSCGYPVPDMSLQWAPGLYVTGPLGELEIGPVARNIVGAKRAAERIVAAARGLL